MELVQWLKDNGKKHVVDCTGMLSVCAPVFCLIEKTVVGLDDVESIKVRGMAALTSYLGIGLVVARGRDFSRKLFKITDETKEVYQQAHDLLYLTTFSAMWSPLLYLISGNTNPEEIFVGTLTSVGLGAFMGPPLGYAVDLYRDLTGVEESKRVPELVRNFSPKAKIGLAALLTVASVGVMAGIYKVTPDNLENNVEQIEYGL